MAVTANKYCGAVSAKKTQLISANIYERYLQFNAGDSVSSGVRSMNRRQFGAMLATATVSFGSLETVVARGPTQSTESLEVEDVSVTLGTTTMTVERVALTYDESAMEFEISDWTTESTEGSLSIATVRLVAEEVSPETYATVRSGMVEAFEGQSLTPLLSVLGTAEIAPDAPVEMVHESVEVGEQLVADRIRATGTARSVIPEGTRALARGEATIAELDEFGVSEWSQLTIQRGNSEFIADDVVMELDGGAVAVSSPGGEILTSGRTFEFSDMEVTVRPPETVPTAHVEFATEMRQLAGDGDLTLPAIESAASETGVTASNTVEAGQNVRVAISLADVTENGEPVISDFATSGTVAELAQVLGQRT